MVKRLNVLVKSCGECPYLAHRMDIGTRQTDWYCMEADKVFPEKSPIPSWCPLPDDVTPPPAQAVEQPQ